MQVSILVSDQQAIARKGIISILEDALGKKSFGHVKLTENSEPHHLPKKISEIQPSLLITDYLQHQDSVNLLKSLKKNSPWLKLLIISQDSEMANIKKAVKIGVDGYLTRQCESEEMVNAVSFILKDKRFFCPSITEKLLEYEKEVDSTDKLLSKRELEIIVLIAKGHTTNQIAKKLFISIHTVNSHRKNILKKLDLKSPIELVTYAFEKGLVGAL